MRINAVLMCVRGDYHLAQDFPNLWRPGALHHGVANPAWCVYGTCIRSTPRATLSSEKVLRLA